MTVGVYQLHHQIHLSHTRIVCRLHVYSSKTICTFIIQNINFYLHGINIFLPMVSLCQRKEKKRKKILIYYKIVSFLIHSLRFNSPQRMISNLKVTHTFKLFIVYIICVILLWVIYTCTNSVRIYAYKYIYVCVRIYA